MRQHFPVRINRLTNGLFATLFLLIVVNLLICLPYLHRTEEIQGVARIFSLDGERNIPTAYNVFLLLADALFLFVIAAWKVRNGLMKSLGWLVLSFGFVFMSMDEAWTIHEDLIGPMRQELGSKHFGLFYNAWIIPGGIVAALVGIGYLRFLLSLPKVTRIGFIVSGLVYVSGALVMEAFDGNYLEAHGNNFDYKLMTILEEGLEMSGLILFCRYLLQYMRMQCDRIEFTFGQPARARAAARRLRVPAPPQGIPVPYPVSHKGHTNGAERPGAEKDPRRGDRPRGPEVR